MPDPPDVSLVSRYLFENPWPLGLALLATAAWLGWTGLREGLARKLQGAAIAATGGILVLMIGFLVTTSGERARDVTRQLVDAVVQKQTPVAISLFANEAVLSFGSPRNPGFDFASISDHLSRLADRYTIESNKIMLLRGSSEFSDAATVHLECATTVEGIPNFSQWVLRVRRQTDGDWKIEHITCISINNQTPPLHQLW